MALGSMGQARSRRLAKARVRDYRVPRMRARLRVASNIGLILGQCILLFASREAGLSIIILSSVLSFPYFLHEKMWDVVALVAFMNVVNIVGLFVQ